MKKLVIIIISIILFASVAYSNPFGQNWWVRLKNDTIFVRSFGDPHIVAADSVYFKLLKSSFTYIGFDSLYSHWIVADTASFDTMYASKAELDTVISDTMVTNKLAVKEWYYQVQIGIVDSATVWPSDSGDSLRVSASKQDFYVYEWLRNNLKTAYLDTFGNQMVMTMLVGDSTGLDSTLTLVRLSAAKGGAHIGGGLLVDLQSTLTGDVGIGGAPADSALDITGGLDVSQGAIVGKDLTVGDTLFTKDVGPSTGASSDLGFYNADYDSVFADNVDIDTRLNIGGGTPDSTTTGTSAHFTSGLKVDKVTSIGAWGYTGEHAVIPEGSSNTNPGLGMYGMVNYAASAGKVFAGTYSRMLAMTTNQTNQSTMVGVESQFRLRDVNLADGVHAGLWAYAEQSGTSVLSGGGTFDAISATVESESGFSAGATEHITGITLDGSIHASATLNANTNYSAIYIKSNGKDWFDGIKITGVENDIELRNGATIDNTSANLLTITEPTIKIDGDLDVTGKAVIDDSLRNEGTSTLIGNVGIGTATPKASSLTLGNKGTQRDLIITREDVPNAMDSSLYVYIASGQPILRWNASDADQAQVTINNSDALLFENATGGYRFDQRIRASEHESIGNMTLDANLASDSYVNITNEAAGDAKLYIEGNQVDSDDLSDVASIGMLNEDETVSGRWTYTDLLTSSDSISGAVITANKIDLSTGGAEILGLKIKNAATDSSQFMPDSTNLQNGSFVINNAGNVGIGTTVPIDLLHINGSTAGGTYLDITNTGSGQSKIYFDASNGDLSGSDYMSIGQDNDLSGHIKMETNAGRLAFDMGTTEAMTIIQGGNVGIGATNPGAKIEVYGNKSADTLAIWRNNKNTSPYDSCAGVLPDGSIFSTAAITASGIISGMSSITLDTDPTIVLTAAMCKNMIRFNNDADVIDYTLPSVEVGLVIMIYDIGGGVITIDPYDGTDTIYLDGTSVGAGDAIDSPGVVGNFICLIGLDDTRWVTAGRSGTWLDGGPD